MALFSAAIRRGSVCLSKFSFLSHVQVFSCDISSVFKSKYLYSCSHFNFCFLLIVVLLIFTLSVFFFCNYNICSLVCSLRIDASTLSSMLLEPFPPYFLDTNYLCHLLYCKVLGIDIIFLVWSICRSHSCVHFKNCLEYLPKTKETAEEEARWQLHKNVESDIEQVLAATPHKAPTIWPPSSHHEKYTS